MDRHSTADSGKAGLEQRLARLMTEIEALGAGRENRRDALLERAEARGVDRQDAELAYDVALEEGLEPAYALAVVGQGIAVQMFESSTDALASESVEPEWIDAPPDPESAERERRLRETFRRLRSLMEASGDPHRAITAFGEEPDLEAYDY